MAVEKNKTWLKGKAIFFSSIIFRLLGRITIGEKGNGTDILGKKIKI